MSYIMALCMIKIDDLDVVTQIEIEALLSFLQAGVTYQSRVSRIMRTVSESLHLVQYHQHVDESKYKNSTQLKRINLFVSRQAGLLMRSTQASSWRAPFWSILFP